MTTLPTASELMALSQKAKEQRVQQLEAQIAPVLRDVSARLREVAGKGQERLTFPLAGYALTAEEQALLVQRIRQSGYAASAQGLNLTVSWDSPPTRKTTALHDIAPQGGVRLLLREGE